MLTEIFLLLFTLCIALVKKEETLPCLLYCVVSYAFYFCAVNMENILHIYKLAAIFEVVYVVLLFCLKDCLSSRLIPYLIPVSLAATGMHFIGWMTEYYTAFPHLYNNMVKVYYVIMLVLILTVGRNGNSDRYHRFLRGDNDNTLGVEKVSA